MNIKNFVFVLLLTSPVCLTASMKSFINKWPAIGAHTQPSGAWLVTDKTGKIVLVEGGSVSPWQHGVISSEADLDHLSAMFADTFEQIFIDLGKESRVAHFFSKSLDFIHNKNHHDRFYDECIEKMSTALTQRHGDLYYVFTVSEQLGDKKTLLGAVIFDIKGEYDFGTVELDLIAVKPEAQGRGLSAILASTIFKFLQPHISRIILDALFTNKKAQAAYVSFGFTKYDKHNQLISLIDPDYHYEYLTDKHSKLQEVAATFKELRL
jgi:ribosomal protein S18 acetylase RimI-like enzyme